MDDYFTSLSSSELATYYNSISTVDKEDFTLKLKEHINMKRVSIEKVKRSILLLKERIHCIDCILLRQIEK